MQLLTSPVFKFPSGEYAITCYRSSIFKFVSDAGHYEGCGFISEKMLRSLVVDKNLESIVGIQVRCVVPTMGLFKGMLMRKRDMIGGHEIELNSSMLKAGPSKHGNHQEWGIVAITRIASSKTNLSIGKLLDPDDNWTPTKS